MMETRITREMEKNKSVLYKARGRPMAELGGFDNVRVPPVKHEGSKGAQSDEQRQQQNPDEELSPEQLQMFEQENQDMIKHYEATLDQVRYATEPIPELRLLKSLQDGREVSGRDIGATNTAGQQP